jgi:outer membrane protein assembly factor BamB
MLWPPALAQAVWPQFRGPSGSGIATDGDHPPIEFGIEKRLVWKTKTPSGHSSPSIWGNHIFLTAFRKDTQTLQVLAVDRISGRILWERAVPAEGIEKVHEISSPATATPAVDGNHVIAYFGSYGLLCFDFEGRELWKVPLGVANVIPYGSGTSPVIAGDFVLLNRDEGAEPYLLAVDRNTGKIVWKQKQYMGSPERRTGSKATPVIFKDEIILHRRNEIVGFDLATGSRKWWAKTETQGAGTPVAGPNAVYVATWFNSGEPDLRVPLPDFDALLKLYDKNGDGLLSEREFPEKILVARRIGLDGVEGADQALPARSVFPTADRNKDGQIDRAEWEEYGKRNAERAPEHGLLAIRPGGRGDVGSTRVVWKETRGVPEVPAPLWFQGRVYTISDGGVVSCLDAETGKLIYRGRVAGGAYFASPIAADGRIYLSSGDGIVTVIKGGDRLEPLARNDLQEPLFATPAVAGDAIYIRTPTMLYAFAGK